MREETPEHKGPLRSGYTTGSCATATSLAATRLLLTGELSDTVEIVLPKGKHVIFPLTYCRLTTDGAEAGTVKDAGDDPDVTHGALVFAQVRLIPQAEIYFRAGPGVGTVTQPGLLLAVGEPAINPVPRRMMTEHLQALAQSTRYSGGIEVSIGVENGEHLALKTMNPRLGILGGLSILGTTGIVRPFSCSAYIASIHQAMEVAYANGCLHLAACTGNTSEATMRQHYGLTDMALVEMGDFVGAVLKHAKRVPLRKLSVCGGFGKISKLAAGHLDLHSRHTSVEIPRLAALAADLGADAALQASILQSNTSQQALVYAKNAGLALGDAVCAQAVSVARKYVPAALDIEVIAIDRQGNIVGHAA